MHTQRGLVADSTLVACTHHEPVFTKHSTPMPSSKYNNKNLHPYHSLKLPEIPVSRKRYLTNESTEGSESKRQKYHCHSQLTHTPHPLIFCIMLTPTSPTHWHPLARFQNGPGCTLLRHLTSQALPTSPTPRQRELVCGACIGTAQVGISLGAPLNSIFKRSSLRCLRDPIPVT